MCLVLIHVVADLKSNIHGRESINFTVLLLFSFFICSSVCLCGVVCMNSLHYDMSNLGGASYVHSPTWLDYACILPFGILCTENSL